MYFKAELLTQKRRKNIGILENRKYTNHPTPERKKTHKKEASQL